MITLVCSWPGCSNFLKAPIPPNSGWEHRLYPEALNQNEIKFLTVCPNHKTKTTKQLIDTVEGVK